MTSLNLLKDLSGDAAGGKSPTLACDQDLRGKIVDSEIMTHMKILAIDGDHKDIKKLSAFKKIRQKYDKYIDLEHLIPSPNSTKVVTSLHHIPPSFLAQNKKDK